MMRLLFWGLAVPAILRRAAGWLLESPLVLAARHPWLALAGAGAAVALGGFVVAASGIMPIKASSGHWAVTEALLQFSKRQSVATHAFAITPPPLDDAALVMRGAGHYETGCRPCHGVLGARPAIPRAMTPQPPGLAERVPTWRASELFYIVKHGIKFTGMPAWPSQQRDDEVWAMVAFLQALPRLDMERYRQLVAGRAPGAFALGGAAGPPAAVPDIVRDTCVRCHGRDGQARGLGAFPTLAGQRPEYLARALAAFATGRRHSGIMGPIAGALTPRERMVVANYYAGQPAGAGAGAAAGGAVGPDPRAIDRGAAIARSGVPAQKVPSCADCHGPAAAPSRGAYPRLAGQYAEYLAGQLELLQQRRRGGSEYVHLMHSFVDRLTREQIADVSAYYASLGGP